MPFNIVSPQVCFANFITWSRAHVTMASPCPAEEVIVACGFSAFSLFIPRFCFTGQLVLQCGEALLCKVVVASVEGSMDDSFPLTTPAQPSLPLQVGYRLWVPVKFVFPEHIRLTFV